MSGLDVFPLPEGAEERLQVLREGLRVPRPERPWIVAQAFREGFSVEEVAGLSAIDPWFLRRICALVLEEIEARGLRRGGEAARRDAARGQEPGLQRPHAGASSSDSRSRTCARCATALGVRPVYKRVDTCAAEFEAYTPYLYSSYDQEDEAPPTDRKKVLILGSGPIRIGQGIEFDYCCVHAAFALREAGLRDGDAQLQPGDRLHRLRHQRSPVLRAAHHRGRARGRAAREAGGRHRAVRRADAAAPLGAAGAGGAAHPGDQPGGHRPRRGSRALLRADREARSAPAGERHRAQPGRGLRHRRAHRLPGDGASQLRARRPRDGGGLRRAEPRPVHEGGGAREPGAPGAHRPLPEARGGGGPGSPRRPHRRGDRGRRHGARGGGRRALRRRERHPAPLQRGRRADRGDEAGLDRAGPRARRGRPDERAVRHPGTDRLRPRGEPARQPHHPLHQQGHRRPAREARRAGHGGPDARGARGHRGSRAAPRGGEGERLPLQPLRRRGHASSGRR